MLSRPAAALLWLSAVACSGPPEPSASRPPDAIELPAGQFAWMSVTGRSLGGAGGIQWTAVPLVCGSEEGALHKGTDCIGRMPIGAQGLTFQGRTARLEGPGEHPCSFERRTVPGWTLWLDPAAEPKPGRPFSVLGTPPAGAWVSRDPRLATEAERVRVPGTSGEPQAGALVHAALSHDLHGDDRLETLVEVHRPGAGSELWLLGSERAVPIPPGAARADSLREVAGVLDLGDHGVLAMVLSRSPTGGAGKHVLRFGPGEVELVSEWWCGSPPPSTPSVR